MQANLPVAPADLTRIVTGAEKLELFRVICVPAGCPAVELLPVFAPLFRFDLFAAQVLYCIQCGEERPEAAAAYREGEE